MGAYPGQDCLMQHYFLIIRDSFNANLNICYSFLQVDFSMDLPDKVSYVASQDLDLNFPPSSNIIADSETNMIVEDIIADFKISRPAMKLVEPVVDGNRNKGQESNSCISPSAAGSSISYPIDLSEAPPAVTSAAPTSVAEVQASSQDDIEMALLKELGEMGFKQVNLNKEVLRMNGYNLEQTIADLCGASEWDPMLEELEEMVGINSVEISTFLICMLSKQQLLAFDHCIFCHCRVSTTKR